MLLERKIHLHPCPGGVSSLASITAGWGYSNKNRNFYYSKYTSACAQLLGQTLLCLLTLRVFKSCVACGSPVLLSSQKCEYVWVCGNSGRDLNLVGGCRSPITCVQSPGNIRGFQESREDPWPEMLPPGPVISASPDRSSHVLLMGDRSREMRFLLWH